MKNRVVLNSFWQKDKFLKKPHYNSLNLPQNKIFREL